ncbi:hypothetical protein TruAng_010206 [Truncatella angustata]|nr:hypothetical protein TruAng_010206 [Truncatella angustata]
MAEYSKTEEGPPTQWNYEFVEISNNLRPQLHRWQRRPQRIVEFKPDDDQYFGLKATPAAHTIDELPSLSWAKDDSFILDFGIHMVGLRFTFGESPLDVTLGMDNVKTWISTSWLPDEVLNIDMCPEQVALPRRYAFRYARVDIVDTSPKYQVVFSDFTCESVSAVSQSCKLDMPQLQDPLLQAIDHASISTLRDCMQTVFEDGPRRDRRLWMGDLRLEALANYSTFRDFQLVKRNLFQFAAVARVDGSLPACIFEQPRLTPSTDYIVDYDVLFSATVYDYVVASNDLETGRVLWSTVLGCVGRALSNLNPDTYMYEKSRSKDWNFLDWQDGLEHSAGLHGVLLFSLKAIQSLGELLRLESPFRETEVRMTEVVRQFISPEGCFISGSDAQISYASASWLVLSGALPKDMARQALLKTLAHPDALKPLTPYLWHHVCDALASVGCYDECTKTIKSYWGGMVKAGADTFWEAYDPKDSHASPYGDVRNNSFCHAWSCTPTYLLRARLGDSLATRGEPRSVTVSELDEAWVKRQLMHSEEERNAYLN